MGGPKDEVSSLLQKLPDDASFEDIQYHLYVLGRGLARADAEGAISGDAARERPVHRYRLEENRIVVAAVIHARRDFRSQWRSRDNTKIQAGALQAALAPLKMSWASPFALVILRYADWRPHLGDEILYSLHFIPKPQ